jgi:hypothetical protein
MTARGNLVWRACRSRVYAEKGAIEQLYTARPAGSVVVCLDEMGPQVSKSYPGQRRGGQERQNGPPRRSTMAGGVSPAMCSAPSSRPRERP